MCLSLQLDRRGRSCPALLLLLLLSSPPPTQGAISIPKDYKVQNMMQPPVLTELPESYTAFTVEDISLACEATGIPTPRFRWVKDGEELLLEDQSSGTFTANGQEPLSSYQGNYRCYASNTLGTAMTHTVQLITEATPTLPKQRRGRKTAIEGASIILHCNPPHSSTPPRIHWMDRKLNHIGQSERVTTGLDGNLYFANLLREDSRDDYTCNAHYIGARTILPKEPISLLVTHSNEVLGSRKPHLLRPSGQHSSRMALRGHILLLECIPQGLPTPMVQWRKKDGDLADTGAREENYGRWLRFDSLTQEDDGEYECVCSNTAGSEKHSYTVTVEAAPYWVKQPQSLQYSPGETVRLDCQAEGIPTPNITWSINGVPITAVDPEPRRRVWGGVLILRDVEYADTAIYQCEASNTHGSIIINTYIYVIELPPQVLSSDGVVYWVTEGGQISLHCDTFGSPRPHISWESEGMELLLSDPRVSLLTNGTLELTNASREDAGTYTCSLTHTNISITAHLEVLNRTVMLIGPQSERLIRGSECSLDCLFYKDPQLTDIQVVWRKDGRKIMETDKYTTFENGTLRVRSVQSEDGGLYSCEVITRLDKVEARGSITVVAPPDPPRALSLSELQDNTVTLSWTPGHTHNSPTTEFVVEGREEQHSDEGRWEEKARVSGDVGHLELRVLPFSTYRFRVTGVNELGRSVPSEPSDSYSTSPAVPGRNPDKVRSESTDPGTLLIMWDEMPPREYNGPGFQYKVSWRQAGGRGPHWSHAYTPRPPMLVNDSGVFTPWEIKVQAVNSLGEARELAVAHKGHSGEDVPLGYPTRLKVQVQNSTARVSWEAISTEQTRGLLTGYRIYLTWIKHGRHRRALERREGVWGGRGGGQERVLEDRRVLEVNASKTEEDIPGLKLYSLYELSITAVNSKGEGPHTPTQSFNTPEGAPGPPSSLQFESPSETELSLHWRPPLQPNGILTGYLLEYHPLESQESPQQMEFFDDPSVTHFLLKGLDPHRHYLFSVFARTAAGRGLPLQLEGATLLDGAPPSNISMVAGDTSVNLSWVPGDRQRNHAFHFLYLRKTAGGEWEESEQVNSTQGSYLLMGLQPGTQYRLLITHDNHTHWEDEIQTAGPELSEVLEGFATQGWFIGLISALVLLVLLLLVLCFIKRSRGGKYAVKDKEEGQLDSEARPMKDEAFGEYSDVDEKRSASPSLGADSKLPSDDSLAEYGDSVDIQFNEDGSFIGQYSGRGPVPHGNESSGPASPENPAPPPPLAPSLSAILNMPT
ncbi:neural cell adhesion molecule L1.1-like isoform X2 [Hypomesus transpacificus]|uniref:neural cell adhesion molecule L1.1-like isoform X2 n=1 Tax=Hypomesus transpacificus TaxID=137520 RepID=UPI001F07B3ED|nr:neural cell adhesion molecule L1.1-like isoform X2 [Hypomesus transpacificus]